MAERVKHLVSEDQVQNEFDYIENVLVRYRQIFIGFLIFICFYKWILGDRNLLLYLTSGLYISYLSIIGLIRFPKVTYDSSFFRALRIETNVIFTSILLYYLREPTFEYYLLFIPWIMASSAFFGRVVSLLITTQIAAINIVVLLITLEDPIENVYLSSSIIRTFALFLVWWLSRWWWERRMLSQERRKRLQVLHDFQMEAMDLDIRDLLKGWWN